GCELDAVGEHHRAMPQVVVRRRLANDLAEGAAEGPPAGEADIEADIGDTAVRLAQQEHRTLHPPPLQVTVRRLPEDGAEAADEVRLGEMRHGSYGADVERLGIGPVHGIAGAQQAPVELLDFLAHAATLGYQEACARERGISGRRVSNSRMTQPGGEGGSSFRLFKVDAD